MYTVAFNKNLDFGLAINRVVHAKAYAKSGKDLAITAIPEIEAIVQEMLAQISVAKMALLKRFVTTYYFDNLLIECVYDYPTYSLDALIETFEAQSPEQFLSYVNMTLLRGKVQPSQENTLEAVQAAIEKANGNNPAPCCMSFKTYKQMVADPREAQELFLDCIRYFKPIYGVFAERIEAIRSVKTPYYVAQFDIPSQRQKIDDLVVFNDPVIEAFPKIVYLSVFLDRSIRMDVSEDRGCITVVFGVSLEAIFEDRDLDQEVLKCLADPTKMEMLKIISQQEVCAKDLVGLLKLSKSNISHHIGKLSYAELISIQMKEGNKAYYTVNTSKIQEVFERTMSQFKG